MEQTIYYDSRIQNLYLKKSAIQGSIFDMVIQNSPYQDFIFRYSQLGIQH